MSTRLFAVLRTAFFGTLFVALWTWLAPRWMAMSKHVVLQPVLGWHLLPTAIGAAREVGRWMPRLSPYQP